MLPLRPLVLNLSADVLSNPSKQQNNLEKKTKEEIQPSTKYVIDYYPALLWAPLTALVI